MPIAWGPEVYNRFVALYTKPVFRVGEVLLAGAVLYHALNGTHIIIIDFWTESTKFQRQMFYAVAGIFVIIFVPAAIVMLMPIL